MPRSAAAFACSQRWVCGQSALARPSPQGPARAPPRARPLARPFQGFCRYRLGLSPATISPTDLHQMIVAMADLLWPVGWVLPTALCLICAQGLAHAQQTPAGRQAALEQPLAFGRAILASASMPLAEMDLRKLDDIGMPAF